MKITIPDLSLVVLMGASGCGKSTFAAKHFLPTETVSSDACRGIISNDENSQAATNDAFDLLHYIARKRLSLGHLTVVDATNVQPESRKPLLKIADEYHAVAVAIVFLLREEICHERNLSRPDRQFGPHVVRGHYRSLRQSLGRLQKEGFRHVYVLHSPEEVESVTIERTPLWPDKRSEPGPFDIVGDIHGCFDELLELMANLGYTVTKLDEPIPPEEGKAFVRGVSDWSWLSRYYDVDAPEGRKAIFLGDLVDRGPNSPEVLKLVMSMMAQGQALCVPGNHDQKLVRKLAGRDVQLTHGIAETLEQLEREPEEFRQEVRRFLDSLISHYVLDAGNLVVAHAGMKAEMQGRASARIRDFALYGETTGETDEFGLPGRYNWAADYRGKARVVYGHTPVLEAEWLNHTINIDTGCVFGGKLTALRYPEMELVSVLARKTYAESIRPLLGSDKVLSIQHEHDDVLDLSDVSGKRIIYTRLRGNVSLREENAIAALEAMSRFAANPRWLVYLPPTMSPSETSMKEGLLEHPEEAFGHFQAQGVQKVICEEKHMGSRAVAILCRNADVAQTRFGVTGGERGIVYTRTGRRFFDDLELEGALLDRMDKAMEAAGLWQELKTDWAIFDCELMPWSAKAQELLKRQYAPVGAAAVHATSEAVVVLDAVAARCADEECSALAAHMKSRAEMAEAYVNAYRRYCWPVSTLDDLKLAPFHLLASEGAVHVDKDHTWHMETVAKMCSADAALFLETPFRVIDPFDPESVAAGVQWWEELTGTGGEGMVVKPLSFVASSTKGLIQPAVKCRGREYLRIIYGPEYTAPYNLERLRKRGLGVKRSLALREFALGVEALERFVRREPLRRVHECVFAVLALESEPVDPRL